MPGPDARSPEDPREASRARRGWRIAAVGVLVAATLWTFWEPWAAGPREHAPSLERPAAWRLQSEADLHFVAWGIDHNAWWLLRAPWRLFEGEQCYPAEDSLAFGHPMIGQGVVAAPIRLVLGDPILSYNATLFVLVLLGALAMYALVEDWTGVPPAGIAAALVFAFHSVALARIQHLCIYDTSWTVLALYFGRRLFVDGRWRDAVGLGACAVLQVSSSFYTAAAAFFIALPMAVWLPWAHGVRALRPGRVALAAGIAAAGCALVLLPYVELADAEHMTRARQRFAMVRDFVPGAAHFPGWIPLALALLGLLGGSPSRERPERPGDPRPALAAAALAVAAAAFGSPATQWLPGLERVRAPLVIANGLHLLAAILAGLGVAALLRRVPGRARPAFAAALVAVVAVDTLRPAGLGLPPARAVIASWVRPEEEAIELHRRLAAMGNEGPLAEVAAPLMESRLVLLSAFHHRRTSACYTAFEPASQAVVADALAQLPAARGTRRLRRLGFTTLIVHHNSSYTNGVLAARLERNSRSPVSGLRVLHRGHGVSAFALVPDTQP